MEQLHEADEKFMLMAIELATDNVLSGAGGPFGAVIVKNGKVIATGVNKVTASNDPTAHAEVIAIRGACARLKTFNLSDCELFTSCEPCPMCLAAIYWARIPKVYYGNTRADAAAIGFDDDHIYRQLALPPGDREVKMRPLLRKKAAGAFKAWARKPDKVAY